MIKTCKCGQEFERKYSNHQFCDKCSKNTELKRLKRYKAKVIKIYGYSNNKLIKEYIEWEIHNRNLFDTRE